jgi:hypothetical protein
LTNGQPGKERTIDKEQTKSISTPRTNKMENILESMDFESESDEEETSLIQQDSLSQLTWCLHNEKEGDIDPFKNWENVNFVFSIIF